MIKLENPKLDKVTWRVSVKIIIWLTKQSIINFQMANNTV